MEGHVISHGSQSHTVSSGLSDAGKRMVCCHISNENQEFEYLVRSASNLSQEEKEKYIGKLYHDCGISSSDRDKYHYDDTEQQEVKTNKEELNMHRGSNSNQEQQDDALRYASTFFWAKWSSARGCITSEV